MEQTKCEFRFNGADIWEGLIADIQTAQESIELEQYSFFDDKIGRRFLELFREKLQSGVKIRLICDALNSRPLLRSSYLKELEKMGLEVIAFNSPQFSNLNKLFFRIHRKILIVDSKIAWVGGIGIKDKFATFRDTQVRLEGPVAMSVKQSFDAVWYNRPSYAVDSADEEYRFLVNEGRFQKKEIYEWMRQSILEAKKSIYIATSYFYPDRNFFQLILNKSRQGVNVKLLLRGSDDEFFPLRFSASYFKIAIQNGIELYRYLPTIMHAKTVIIDDSATIGSCNLDKFSFYYNLEANVVSSNSFFVQQLKTQFFEDLKVSRHITKEDWHRRPYKERLLEIMVWPFHNYL